MRKRLITMLVSICMVLNFATAQVLKLDLAQSIQLACDSSFQSFSAKNLYRANYWQFRSFKAGRLPSLVLRTTPLEYKRDFTQRYDSEKNIDVFREQQSMYSYGNLSIRQNFDLTGGTFYIDSELGYRQNLGENNFSQFSAVPIRIGYSQSLFGFNHFKWEKKIEPLKWEKAKQQYLSTREAISQQVITNYFNMVMAQAEYDMAKATRASADTLYYIGQERYKIASISQSDLLTLKLDVVNAKNTLRNAEISLKRAMFNFLSYLNMDKDIEIQLEIPQRPQDIEIPIDLALQYTQRFNPEYIAFRQQTFEAEKEVDRAKKASVFDAGFDISAGFNQAADNLVGAYQHPLRQDIIRIRFTIPLVDWGVKKGQVNMAKSNLNITKIDVGQKMMNLEQDIVMTVSDFNIQRDLILSAEEALELANMAYNITKQHFIIGKADINSLTLSLNRQSSAQRNYISALNNYWQSYYKIRKLTLFDFIKQESLSAEFDKVLGFSE